MSKTVFILGAGASCGAGFKSYRNVEPPVLKDFFKTFAKFNYFQYRGQRKVDDFFNFLYTTFGWTKANLQNGEPDLEIILDSIDNRLEGMELNDNNYQDYVKCRRFKSFIEELIAETLHRTTWEEKGLKPPNCPYHESIVKTLQKDDLIINLNYDLIMDMALINHNWNWITGYGLPFKYVYRNHVNAWEQINTSSNNLYCYLKLHGSLNWFISTETVQEIGMITYRSNDGERKNVLHLVNPVSWYKNPKLRTYQYSAPYNASSSRYFLKRLIVGPGRKKKYDILEHLWKIAESKLSDVKEVFIIGCSLRDNDCRLQTLLKDYIPWSSLDNFVIADPKEEIKNKIEDKFNRKSTEYLKNIKELSDYLKTRNQSSLMSPGIINKEGVSQSHNYSN